MRLLVVWVTALVLVLSPAVLAQSAKPPLKPGKILIGSFGNGDDAEQLKLALGYELGRAGFKVVDYMTQADSWISGLIVTRVEDGKQIKRVTVFLKDRSGKTIWNEDVGAYSSGSRDTGEALRQRAQDIVKELKKDMAKAKPASKKPATTPPS